MEPSLDLGGEGDDRFLYSCMVNIILRHLTLPTGVVRYSLVDFA